MESVNFVNKNKDQYEIQVDMSGKEFLFKDWSYYQICAICRGCFLENCIDCQSKNYEIVDLENIQEYIDSRANLQDCKEGTFFQKLPKEIVNLIEKRIIIEGVINIQCPIVKGECGHYYHNHCINKWRRKRDCCPLDNEFWAMKTSFSQAPFKLFKK